jgi:outer membrane protein assembly factor BamB
MARVVLLLLIAFSTLARADWPQWRGPARDGVATDAPKEWPAALKLGWKVEVGEGHAGPVIAAGRVFTLSRVGDEEVVRATKLADGSEVWAKKYKASAELDGAVGWHGQMPRSTPCVADGRVYTFGISGVLMCWDAATGNELWKKTFDKKFPKSWPLYGVATSPIVAGGKLIVWAGGPNKGALTAFDPASGEEKWALAIDGPAYVSPVVAKLAGVEQLVTQSQRFLVGVDPKTGKELWKQKFTTGYDQNCVTPVVVGDVIINSGYQTSLKALAVTKSGTEFKLTEKWDVREHPLYMSSAVVIGGLLVGLSMADGGSMMAVDLTDGQVKWKKGNQGEYAAFVVSGDHVLVQTDDGKVRVLLPAADRYEALREYTVGEERLWSHIAVDGGTIVVKDKKNLYCWLVR